jgi:hypothetical protein
VVSVTDPYSRILGFLDRSRYVFFQVAPQLYSQGRVDEGKKCATTGNISFLEFFDLNSFNPLPLRS